MHQQLNSSRPRRAAAMQATAQMMVSALHLLSLLSCLCQLHHPVLLLVVFEPLHASVPRHAPVFVSQAVIFDPAGQSASMHQSSGPAVACTVGKAMHMHTLSDSFPSWHTHLPAPCTTTQWPIQSALKTVSKLW